MLQISQPQVQGHACSASHLLKDRARKERCIVCHGLSADKQDGLTAHLAVHDQTKLNSRAGLGYRTTTRPSLFMKDRHNKVQL